MILKRIVAVVAFGALAVAVQSFAHDQEQQDRDSRTYMKAASVLEEVFAKQPQHPGAAH